MTNSTKEAIAKIIDDHAEINFEFGEDVYVINSEQLAELILDTIYHQIHIKLG